MMFRESPMMRRTSSGLRVVMSRDVPDMTGAVQRIVGGRILSTDDARGTVDGARRIGGRAAGSSRHVRPMTGAHRGAVDARKRGDRDAWSGSGEVRRGVDEAAPTNDEAA